MNKHQRIKNRQQKPIAINPITL